MSGYRIENEINHKKVQEVRQGKRRKERHRQTWELVIGNVLRGREEG
jgi:hypothetical protein